MATRRIFPTLLAIDIVFIGLAVIIGGNFFVLAHKFKIKDHAKAQSLTELSELCSSKGGTLVAGMLGNLVCVPTLSLHNSSDKFGEGS